MIKVQQDNRKIMKNIKSDRLSPVLVKTLYYILLKLLYVNLPFFVLCTKREISKAIHCTYLYGILNEYNSLLDVEVLMTCGQ